MNWKSAFDPRNEIVLSTTKKNGDPHAIYVLSMGIVDNKVVIGVCLMKTTLENIKNNKKAVVVGKCDDGYFRIYGEVNLYPSGKYLDKAVTHSRPPMPEEALTIEIEEVYDMGNQKKII